MEFQEKELLSWRVIAEILLYIEQPVGIAVLHPGGGQYDTLSLVSRENEVLLSLNRNGSSALIKNQMVGDFWEIASKNFGEAVSLLAKMGGLNAKVSPEGKNFFISSFASEVAEHLEKHSNSTASAQWGWTDSSYGSGPNSEVLDNFSFSLIWKSIEPLVPGTDWQSNIFILTSNQNSNNAVHMLFPNWKISPMKRN